MEIDKNNLHHAYLILGEIEESRSSLMEYLKTSGVLKLPSPDFFVFQDDAFGVKDARQLARRAQGKALTGKKVFVVSPLRFSAESQNALLKTFEEPFPDTHFFIIARDEASVIPTLLSRVRVIRTNGSREVKEEAEEFLKLPVIKRIDFAKRFADKEKDLPSFLDSLLIELRVKESSAVKISAVYDIRRFAGDTSASPRLVLEHLALML